MSTTSLNRWYINNNPAIVDHMTEMVIHNVTREYHDAIVKCEVYNEVGKSEETKTLDVTCKYDNSRNERYSYRGKIHDSFRRGD
jgi:hypothetical protein